MSPSPSFLKALWKVVIRSPESLLFSRLNNPNSLCLSSQETHSIPLIIFLANLLAKCSFLNNKDISLFEQHLISGYCACTKPAALSELGQATVLRKLIKLNSCLLVALTMSKGHLEITDFGSALPSLLAQSVG